MQCGTLMELSLDGSSKSATSTRRPLLVKYSCHKSISTLAENVLRKFYGTNQTPGTSPEPKGVWRTWKRFQLRHHHTRTTYRRDSMWNSPTIPGISHLPNGSFISCSCFFSYLIHGDQSTNYHLSLIPDVHGGRNRAYASITPLHCAQIRSWSRICPSSILMTRNGGYRLTSQVYHKNVSNFACKTQFVVELRYLIPKELVVNELSHSTFQWLTCSFFDAFATTVPIEAMTELFFCLTDVTIGTINQLDFSSFLDSLSKAASASKNFAMCAPKVSLIMAPCSRSSITCSKTTLTADKMLLRVLLRNIREMSSSIASESFVNSSHITCLTVYFALSLKWLLFGGKSVIWINLQLLRTGILKAHLPAAVEYFPGQRLCSAQIPTTFGEYVLVSLLWGSRTEARWRREKRLRGSPMVDPGRCIWVYLLGQFTFFVPRQVLRSTTSTGTVLGWDTIVGQLSV